MSKRTVLAYVAAIAALIGTFVMGSTQAHAQNSPLCCQYTVNIVGDCMPISVTTAWAGVPPQTTTYTTAGTYIEPFTLPTYPTCPKSPQFMWVSVDGGIRKIPFNYVGEVEINGCCMIVHVVLDANGCIVIKIYPC